MRTLYALLFLFLSLGANSQTLPLTRSVDWTLAGLKDTTTTNNFIEINMVNQGAIGDSLSPNDSILNQVLSVIPSSGAILNFSSGNFLFNQTINLPDNVIIKGEGAEFTTFTMELGGTGHSFSIQGTQVNSDTTAMIQFAPKDSSFIMVADPSSFSIGDWIQIVQNDTDLVTSSWAENTVGQILKINSISNNKIGFESPLRMDYDTIRSPYILKIFPAKNIGIECLKIHRLDNTAPEQSSNIHFALAVNCWVKNIESENCTFSHIQANRSSNLYFSTSYFHHGFEYGGGGRAYGIALQTTSNECLVENNIFEHLRHSMLIQSGANGNVFAYNYSFDPFWDLIPNNSAGDLVLHGNYPFANLFEQNIVQNMVIDNSHGPNGPHNTLFRNRGEKYGLFFSATNSPNQNFLGNEIPNSNFPYSFVNYTILGSGHFVHGNNNKGVIHPAGTDTLPDVTYAYFGKPNFIPTEQWAGIGTMNNMGENSIPAYDRYHSGNLFSNTCSVQIFDNREKVEASTPTLNISLYPNPTSDYLHILSRGQKEIPMGNFQIVDTQGRLIQSYNHNRLSKTIVLPIHQVPSGIYFLIYKQGNGMVWQEKIVIKK